MAELGDVLGAVLRDITQSRVTGDLFSRDVSREYARDAILSAFPVPRVEIKEASIKLRLAINAVESKSPETEGLIRTQVTSHAQRIAERLFRELVLEHPKHDELTRMLEAAGKDLEKEFSVTITNALLSAANALQAALEGDAAKLVGLVGKACGRELRRDKAFWAALRRGMLVRDIDKRVEDLANVGVREFAEHLAAALGEASKLRSTGIDVAVTKRELAEIPDFVMSDITLVTEIRNYEWTEMDDAEGNVIRRLQPV